MSEEKGMGKVIFTVFVVVLLAILFFHFYKVNEIQKQFETKVSALEKKVEMKNEQITKLRKEVNTLLYKLEVADIINQVARNNFGLAQDKMNALISKLEAEKHPNIEQIKKIQDELNILFPKKDNQKIIETLGMLQKVIELK